MILPVFPAKSPEGLRVVVFIDLHDQRLRDLFPT